MEEIIARTQEEIMHDLVYATKRKSKLDEEIEGYKAELKGLWEVGHKENFKYGTGVFSIAYEHKSGYNTIDTAKAKVLIADWETTCAKTIAASESIVVRAKK